MSPQDKKQNQESDDVQEYVLTGTGNVSRRQGKQLKVYIPGDKIPLSPRAAYHLRGKLETLGGLKIPADLFDGKNHPHVERKAPTTPEERAAALVGSELASSKTSLAGVGNSRKATGQLNNLADE